MCPWCSGDAIYISETEPYVQLPCPNCGSRKMFIYNGDEEKVIRGLVEKRSQMKLEFPSSTN